MSICTALSGPTPGRSEEGEDRGVDTAETDGTPGDPLRSRTQQELEGLPGGGVRRSHQRRPPGKKALVTGCYDWLHSGHVRFFEKWRS